MPNFNKTIIMGNLTRDPELKFTPKGTAIGNLSVAINRTWTNEAGEKKEDVTFVDVTAFGKSAETIAQYLKKGNPILVEGRLHTESWDDKNTGQKRSKLTVILESFQFIGSKDDQSASQGQQRSPQGELRPQGRPTQGRPAPEPQDANQLPQDTGDDVPF